MNVNTESGAAVRSSDLVRHPHLQPWAMLPPNPDVCQECAVKHEPDMPHNQQSMFWQYNFLGKHGRWPTWADALAHCTPEMQQHWIRELAKHGVTVQMPAARMTCDDRAK